MTYSVHFRKKVLKIKAEEKLSFVEVASSFRLSKTTVFKWSKNLEPKKKRNRPATKIDMEALKNVKNEIENFIKKMGDFKPVKDIKKLNNEIKDFIKRVFPKKR